MSTLRAFGISAEVPAGWEARAFQHPDGEPTLHVASFPLPPKDADFGTRATDRMPPDALFVALTEYRLGGGIEPGHGLFAAAPPHSLATHELSERALMRPRPGQRGLQRFFSASGRAFCLYVVSSAGGTAHLAAVSRLLRSLRVGPRD